MATYWVDAPNELVGFDVVWPHHCSLPASGQRSVTFTTTVLKGPVYDGEYGSALAVSAKQRPQASPAPRPGPEPKANCEMAAVKPLADIPQAW